MEGIYNVKDYGALGNGQHNDSPAFAEAFEQMKEDAVARGEQPTYGAILYIPPGRYRTTEPVRPKCTCTIQGAGGDGQAPATIVMVDDGVIGIDIDGYVVPDDRCTLAARDFALYAAGNSSPEAHGIRARGDFRIERLTVLRFGGNGIDVYGGVGPPTFSSVSLWALTDVNIAQCGLDGLFVLGPDANVGCAFKVNANSNGRWGIRDESFLGNSYINCHTASNGKYLEGFGGAFSAVGPNSTCEFHNCYSEMDQARSLITKPSMVIGGQHGAPIEGGCLVLHASFVSSLSFRAKMPPSGPAATMALGSDTDALVEITPPGGLVPTLREKVLLGHPNLPIDGPWLARQLNNASSYGTLEPLDLGTSLYQTGEGPHGRAFRQLAGNPPLGVLGGFFWGARATQMVSWVGDTEPSDGTTWAEQDTLVFAHGYYPPSYWVGGWYGAICTSPGTGGTYVEGRTITSGGSNVVQLSAPSNVLRRGMRLVIGNVAAWVIEIVGTTMTMTHDIPTTQNGPILYRNPTWRRFGALEV